MVHVDDLLRPTGIFDVDVLLERIEKHVRAADRAVSLWKHYRACIPTDALATAVHHWDDSMLSDGQAEVWRQVHGAIEGYADGIITLSGPRGVAKSAGAARWAMNRPGEVAWLRASEAGRISLADSSAWQAIHDRLVTTSHRVVIDDLGSFNSTTPVAVHRLGDLLCSMHEAGAQVCITTNFGLKALEEVYDHAAGGQGRLIDRLTGSGSTWVDLWDVAEGVPSMRQHALNREPSPAAKNALTLIKAVYTMRRDGDVEPVLHLVGIDRAAFGRDARQQEERRSHVVALLAPLIDSLADTAEAQDAEPASA